MNLWLLTIQLVPERITAEARQVDAIFWALVAFSTLIIVLVVGLMLRFAIQYRAGRDVDRTGAVTTSWRLELLWISIPAVIGLGLFAWAADVYLLQDEIPPDARTIYVVPKQWMWKFQHPEGVREIDELHVPAGRPTRLIMTSQDVIHSFYVPALRTKQDILPDRYTALWFEPETPGVYHLFCAEYCGTGHSDMIGRVIVMEPERFAQWLSTASLQEPAPGEPGQPGADLAVQGQGVFYDHGCHACHLPTAAVRAPRLDGIWGDEVRLKGGRSVIADVDYIRESILDPQAKITAGYPEPSLMPTYRGQVTEDDLLALIEFIRDLRDGWPAAALAPPDTADRAGATGRPAPRPDDATSAEEDRR